MSVYVIYSTSNIVKLKFNLNKMISKLNVLEKIMFNLLYMFTITIYLILCIV